MTKNAAPLAQTPPGKKDLSPKPPTINELEKKPVDEAMQKNAAPAGKKEPSPKPPGKKEPSPKPLAKKEPSPKPPAEKEPSPKPPGKEPSPKPGAKTGALAAPSITVDDEEGKEEVKGCGNSPSEHSSSPENTAVNGDNRGKGRPAPKSKAKSYTKAPTTILEEGNAQAPRSVSDTRSRPSCSAH